MTSLNQQIGRMIAKRRQARDLTQDQLAEQLELGREALSRLELGKTSLSVPRLFQIAKVLDCSLAELIAEVSDRPDDLIQQIGELLAPLSESDRHFVLSSTEHLVEHLRSR